MMEKAVLWKKCGDSSVRCELCSHACMIVEGNRGFCQVRENMGGELFTRAYGKVIAANCDPIEKKPLYHFLPGTLSYSIATAGCNFTCSFCQNWRISQFARDEDSDLYGQDLTPSEIVSAAVERSCSTISYTYTEPTIFFEYAFQTAQIASRNGLGNVFVTNGYMTDKAIEMIAPFLDAVNVDLKFFSEITYKELCGASLRPVLKAIRKLHKMGIWMEITTLVIPGRNDSDEELSDIASFIADIDKDIPWHISGYHPDFQYRESPATPLASIERALAVAERAGIRYVYPGNVYLKADTECPGCGEVMVKKEGRRAEITNMFKNGKCIKCATFIAGRWE